MPLLALGAFSLFLALAFGLRSAVHYRRTGTTGFVGISGRIGSAEWNGGALFIVALLAGAAAPVLQLAGWIAQWTTLDVAVIQILGAVLYLVGAAGALWAQFAMGDAWRIGVDANERTTMVATGPFRWVRNPIYSSMMAATVGIALLVPNALSAVAVLALVVGLELHVRLVEEPHLTRTHGEQYRRYAERTGRFVPGVGRL